MGYPVPDDAELHRFIGPAISESMQRNGIPDDKLDEGVRITASITPTRPCSTTRTIPDRKSPAA